jgi:hypothetical protein
MNESVQLGTMKGRRHVFVVDIIIVFILCLLYYSTQ